MVRRFEPVILATGGGKSCRQLIFALFRALHEALLTDLCKAHD